MKVKGLFVVLLAVLTAGCAVAQEKAVDYWVDVMNGDSANAECTGTASDCGKSVTCSGDTCEAKDGTGSASCSSTSETTNEVTGPDGGITTETVKVFEKKAARCGGDEDTTARFLFDAFFFPETLNLKTLNRRRFVTVYIEYPSVLPDIDPATVYLPALGREFPAEEHPVEIGDFNDNGIPDMKLKFDLRDIEDCELMPGDESEALIAVDFEGLLTDGSAFAARDGHVKILCRRSK